MRLILDAAKLDWFEARNISFDSRFRPRVKPGDAINFRETTTVEPYVGFNRGHALCEIGFMSFSNAPVPEDLKIGRYCSLGPNLSFPRYRHPIEHISTSVFTHDRQTDLVIRALRDLSPSYANFHPARQKGGITIEHDVWIGQDSALMPGLVIGTGSVIAANSVVTRIADVADV